MRLFALTSLTMVAFAANSILNRLALTDGEIGPAGFAAIRMATGAIVLVLLLAYRAGALPRPARPDVAAIASLALYMLCFSFAYISMDAGLGALVLFGVVQITMFSWALLEGQRPPVARWVGMLCSLGGLALLSWPQGPVVIAPAALFLMALAGFGWGVYSLIGRGVTDPLAATGWNFVYALPVVLVFLPVWPDPSLPAWNGVLLAMLSGGVTSAMGYALWYSLLPDLGATRGALAQLSAPAIALVLGALVLGETLSLVSLLAAALILGGVAIGLRPTRRASSGGD